MLIQDLPEVKKKPPINYLNCIQWFFYDIKILFSDSISTKQLALRKKYFCFESRFSFANEFTYRYFVQIFIQQFDLLLKACLPESISYQTYKESTAQANFSVSILLETIVYCFFSRDRHLLVYFSFRPQSCVITSKQHKRWQKS